MILSSISDASILIWFFVLSCFDLISSSVSTTIWSCAPKFFGFAFSEVWCWCTWAAGLLQEQRFWLACVCSSCLFLCPCMHWDFHFFFPFIFFPLAHSCPASLGASEATGGEMPAVRQGERTSWCVFPQPEERGAKVKQGAIAGLGSRRIPA